ncbi:MAG: tail fiber domain-containing protein [Bacteroidetes bacterium]|nr:tail fiber domain-containing protein [Bacteroidota bacterium]
MKIKLKFPLALLAIGISLYNEAFAQQIQTGAAGVSSEWRRGGNFLAGSAPPAANIFGTMWNSPIYTKTFAILREKLNGTVAYNVNGFVAARDGYMLLGPDAPVGGGTLYNSKGAFSLLHLNGTTTLAAIELGYRPWMKTGITFTENSDLMYVGRKSEGIPGSPTADQTDAVIAWADDGSGPPFFGPDNLRFMFTFGNAAGTSAPNGDLTGGGMDGREVMRMTPQGNVGVGPRFDNSNQPQSTYHQHQENNLSSWMQVTNQIVSSTGPTFVGPNDGFRFGILGAPTAIQNGNAFIYNQEQRHIIFSTGNATPTSIATTNERVRITAIENPTTTTSGYGINNPGGLPTNLTRVSISDDPTTPVTRPLSLLHIGYNTILGNDGWRSWMDVGMFASKSSDNVYLGLKAEPGIAGIPGLDRQDAVLNWGDSPTSSIPTNGPDNLRFIFTSPLGSGLSPASGANGLEGMRMTPSTNVAATVTHVWTGIGGDPTVNLYGPTGASINPTQTLEVNSSEATTVVGGSSGLRFTNLNTTSPTIANPGAGVLAVDADGDVIYVQGTAGTGIGNYCAATPNPIVGNDYEIPLNTFNYRFTGQSIPLLSGVNTDVVGIGYACTSVMPAKFNVLEQATGPIAVNTTATSSINSDVSTSTIPRIYRAVVGITNGVQPINFLHTNIGGDFLARDADNTIGVRGTANYFSQAAKNATGGYFQAIGPNDDNTGVYGIANSSNGANYAVRGAAIGSVGTNYGGFFSAANGTFNYAVYASASTSGAPGAGTPVGPNYAGYFNGDVYISGTYGPSDINLKDSIHGITNAMDIINQLNAKTFAFKHSSYPSMNLPKGLQYGLIAQEVETVLPALITNNVQPAVLDSLGAVVTPAVNFKGLEYQQLIPILIEGMKEQQSKIDSLNEENNLQDSINTYLQQKDSILDERMTALENALNACCNNHSMQQSNSNNSIVSQDVELKDGQAIVLEQNVPNPFAEQTTINYFLPDNVVKAQMLFYNVSGKLIQSVDLNERGKGSLNVFASDLSNGIYTYTLVVDGKIVETKKMVKQQ